MSQMRFCYDDIITDSTVITSNSEETLSPVEYMGNEILGKKYQTKKGFIIKSGYNNIFNFYEGRTGSSTVVGVALSSTTFTGSGLASAVQVAMRAGGKFSSQTVTYNSTTERFTTTKASTATSMALRFDGIDESISEIMGYLKQDYATGTTFISAPTKGNQQWVEMSSPDFNAEALILHEHNFSSGTVLKLRAQSTSTYFHGLNQYGHGDGIFSAFTNLVQDPTDLTTGNWSKANVEITDSGQTIDGKILWLIKSNVAGTYRYSQNSSFVTTATYLIMSVIVRKSDNDIVVMRLRNETDGTYSATLAITFSTKTLDDSIGALLDYEWIDDITVRVVYQPEPSTITIGDSLAFRSYANLAVSDTTGTLWTMPQVVVSSIAPTLFPFVDGTHSADVIEETFTMPDRFTIDMIIKPKFAYDTSISNITMFGFYLSGTKKLELYYEDAGDVFRPIWADDSDARFMTSQSFNSDGSGGLVKLNQRIRILLSFDLTTLDTDKCRFIVIPLESGSLFEDSTWSGTPSIKSSTFSTLSIGYNGTNNQADSDIEYLRIYDGLLVGAVTSSADATTLLASMTKSLDLNYKNTTYMKYCATSTTFGQFEQEITVNEDPCVTLLDEAIAGNVFQLSWADIENSYSTIGRAFLSPIFYPANHPDNKISWFKKKILRRSKRTMAESGATYFDKKDPVEQYTLLPDPLNEYYNPTTKTDMEAFLDAVGDSECFYTILDSSLSNTVYGFIVGNTDYNRQKNTPTIIVPKLLIQEQK